MPNHVTNKITFSLDESQKVFDSVCPKGKFDFKTLVPTPLEVYRGDLSATDEKDFPINWNTWNNTHWGTKWNCYDQSCGEENGKAFIKFDTAWSVPYPIIAAFINKFNISFELKYFDEGENFWGIEKYDFGNHNPDQIKRTSKDFKNPSNKVELGKELKGSTWFDDFEDEG
jgi:hypothetical protein